MYACIRSRAALVLALLALVSPAPVWAWGEEGHRIVARIAAAQLSAKARDGIRDLIGNVSISDYRVALWADEIKRSERPQAPPGYRKAADEFSRRLADLND